VIEESEEAEDEELLLGLDRRGEKSNIVKGSATGGLASHSGGIGWCIKRR